MLKQPVEKQTMIPAASVEMKSSLALCIEEEGIPPSFAWAPPSLSPCTVARRKCMGNTLLLSHNIPQSRARFLAVRATRICGYLGDLATKSSLIFGRPPRFTKTVFLFFLFLLLAPLSPETAFGGSEEKSSAVEGVPEGVREEDLARILKRMEAVYGKLESYQAEFRQVSELRTLQRRKESSGTIYFEKPDLMRWSYRAPIKREVYLDGKQMTLYMPARNTVLRQSLGDALSGTAPAQLFMGPAALKETFRISLADPGPGLGDARCLRLTPLKKGGLSVEEILLWVSGSEFLPVKTESRDLLGNVTTLTFLQGKTNVKLAPEIFRFQPPPDAEIVENLY